MMKLATNENIGTLTGATFTERQRTIKVVIADARSVISQSEDVKVEYKAIGLYGGNLDHNQVLNELNSKPYFGGNPHSELGPGDFLDVYQPTPMYRS